MSGYLVNVSGILLVSVPPVLVQDYKMLQRYMRTFKAGKKDTGGKETSLPKKILFMSHFPQLQCMLTCRPIKKEIPMTDRD